MSPPSTTGETIKIDEFGHVLEYDAQEQLVAKWTQDGVCVERYDLHGSPPPSGPVVGAAGGAAATAGAAAASVLVGGTSTAVVSGGAGTEPPPQEPPPPQESPPQAGVRRELAVEEELPHQTRGLWQSSSQAMDIPGTGGAIGRLDVDGGTMDVAEEPDGRTEEQGGRPIFAKSPWRSYKREAPVATKSPMDVLWEGPQPSVVGAAATVAGVGAAATGGAVG